MGKYDAQERWKKNNIRRVGLNLNKESDKDIIDFLEANRDKFGTANILREALRLLMESKGVDLTPTYYREICKGEKAEMYDDSFGLINVVAVIKDANGIVRMKSARSKIISEGLIRIAKKSDRVEATCSKRPIKGNTLFYEVVEGAK